MLIWAKHCYTFSAPINSNDNHYSSKQQILLLSIFYRCGNCGAEPSFPTITRGKASNPNRPMEEPRLCFHSMSVIPHPHTGMPAKT